MPFDPGSGGAGGGGSTDFCSISPSDQTGQISNILNRLQQIEAALAAILGTDVEALQLSDIANDLGWIYNVTYLGEPGWTQTPSGTLIPPTGWSGLSSVIDGQVTFYGVGSKNNLHRKGSYSSDIASSGAAYITVNTTPITTPTNGRGDSTINGTTYLSPGTRSGNAGWEVLVTGYYNFYVDLSIIAGTSAPTSGDYRFRILKYGSVEGTVFQKSGSVSSSIIYGYIGGTLKSLYLAAGNWVHFDVGNRTDGDIRVDYIQVVGELERAA